MSFGLPPNPNMRAVTIDDFPDPLGPIIKFSFECGVYVTSVNVLKNLYHIGIMAIRNFIFKNQVGA